jgi:hypothetical protein
MRLNIINLIDNFNKFNKFVNINKPLVSHRGNLTTSSSCNELLDNTQNCLIFENKPLTAIKLFDILLKKGKRGLIITRNHPDKICKIISSKKAEMYWLSAEDFDYVIHPWDMNLLMTTLCGFIKKNNQGVILLNGLEYLSTYNDINSLFNVICRMNSLVTNSNAKFFITIDPIALGNRFLSTITNNSEIITMPSNPFKEVLV